MVKVEIKIEGLSVHFERKLTANEGKSPAKLQKKVAEVQQQTSLQLLLLRTGRQCQKIEVVRVFEHLHREIGVGRRKRLLKVRDSFPFSLM